jgi:hypothetical protein
MSIPPVQNSVLSYFRSFDLACVALTRDRRLIGTRDPAGHEMAWWLRAVDAGRVIKWARANSGDVPGASAALGVQLVEHSAAVQRAESLVAKLDARIAQAQRAGDVGFFNREYKRRRQQAQAEGRPFMPYRAAKARLRKALVGVAAGDRPGLITRVFGPQ